MRSRWTMSEENAPPSRGYASPVGGGLDASRPPKTERGQGRAHHILLVDSRAHELERFEAETRRRQCAFQSRMASAEARVAAFLAALARETMDRESSLASLVQRHFDRPLEDCVDRCISKLQDQFVKPMDEALTAANDRMAQLLDDITILQHRTIPHLEHKHWDSTQHAIQHSILADLQVESDSTDRREDAMHRRLQGMAGRCAEHFYQEDAARLSTITDMGDQVLFSSQVDERRTAQFLDQVQQLQDDIVVERKERQEDDQRIIEEIFKTQVLLDNLMLQAVGVDGEGQ